MTSTPAPSGMPEYFGIRITDADKDKLVGELDVDDRPQARKIFVFDSIVVVRNPGGTLSPANLPPRSSANAQALCWREMDSNRRSRLLTFDHEELVGRGFGPPNLAFATSKLPHAGIAVG